MPDPPHAAPPAAAAALVSFWREAGHKCWFAKDARFDADLAARFGALAQAAARRALDGWGETAEGALARVLLLDQLPRNLHRGSAAAYANDPTARAAADTALARGFDIQVEPALRPFLYLPFEHAEAADDQARSVALFNRYAEETGDPQDWLRYARLHADIVARFGRFPHRNAVLGRESTGEERAYLDGGGFRG